MRNDVARITRASTRSRDRWRAAWLVPAVLLIACTQLNHSHDRDGEDAATSGDGGSTSGDRDGGDRGSGRRDGAVGGSSGSGPGGQGGSSSSSALDGGSDGSSPEGADGSADAASDAGDTDARTGNTAPVVTIEFPLSGRTDAESITVRGVVHDAEDDAISSLTVAGTETTVDAEGAFSTVVQLTTGTNDIAVIAEDALGATSATASVSVTRGEVFLWRHTSDVELDGQRALVVDANYDAVFSVDLASGLRTRIADASIDLGPQVTTPTQIEVDYNANCAYVLTSNASAQLQRIDLNTLDRTTVPLNLGSLYITSLAMNNGKLYAAGGSTFFEIQLPAGTPRMISDDADTNLGPALQAATALAIDGSHNIAYLVHQSDGTIKAVTLGSGTRTLFTGGGAGSGPSLNKPLAAVYDYGNQRVLVTDEGQHGVFAISTANATYGVRSILSDASNGTGVMFGSSPSGFAFDPVTQRVLIADWHRPQFIVPQSGSLTWVDFADGHRSYVSNGVGAGQGLASPAELIADPDGDRVLMLDYSAGALIALHLGTGNRLVLSDAVAGQGPPMIGPTGMVADFSNHRVFVADSGRRAVFSVDLGTGDRTLLSDDDHGSGTMFEGPTALIYDALKNRLLVADSGSNSKIMSVNLNGGNRLVLSDNTRTGPTLDQVRAIAFAPGAPNSVLAAVRADLIAVDLVSGNRSYQYQETASGANGLGFALEDEHWFAFSFNTDPVNTLDLQRIELASGDKTLLAGLSRGTGPLLFGLPFTFHLAQLGKVMLVSEGGAGLVLAVDTVSGDRVVFSM